MQPLPDDIVWLIAEAAFNIVDSSTSTLWSMALASKPFNECATLWLYRRYGNTTELGTFRYAQSGKHFWPFIRTLVTRPDHIKYVKQLWLRAPEECSRVFVHDKDKQLYWDNVVSLGLKYLGGDPRTSKMYGVGSARSWELAEVFYLLSTASNLEELHTREPKVYYGRPRQDWNTEWGSMLRMCLHGFPQLRHISSNAHVELSLKWDFDSVENRTGLALSDCLDWLLSRPKLRQMPQLLTQWSDIDDWTLRMTPSSTIQSLDLVLKGHVSSETVKSLLQLYEQLENVSIEVKFESNFNPHHPVWDGSCFLGLLSTGHGSTIQRLDFDCHSQYRLLFEGCLLAFKNLTVLSLSLEALFGDETLDAGTMPMTELPRFSTWLPRSLQSFTISCGTDSRAGCLIIYLDQLAQDFKRKSFPKLHTLEIKADDECAVGRPPLPGELHWMPSSTGLGGGWEPYWALRQKLMDIGYSCIWTFGTPWVPGKAFKATLRQTSDDDGGKNNDDASESLVESLDQMHLHASEEASRIAMSES